MLGRASIRNWDRTQRWRPRSTHVPRTEAEVAQAIEGAVARGERLKAVGGALSWSDIIDVPDGALRFDHMSKVIRVDPETKQITVGGGARLHHVNAVLAKHGLAFDNFGSIVIQTAAGYTGTGSHGTGIRTRILSDAIRRMRLVDGSGAIHELSPKSEPELFKAARVHLGSLGVVTELTFQCVDAFHLEERLELIDFDRALSELPTYLANNDYCKLWWLPYTKQLQLYAFNRTDLPKSRVTVSELIDSSGLSGVAFTGVIGLSRMFPGAVPFLNDAVQRISFGPRRRIDRSDLVIKVASAIPIHQETEYAIPVEQAAKAIEEVRRMVLRKKGYRVNFPMEVRFVGGDDIPLSPASGRDSCYLGAYVASRKWAPRYFAEFEALMKDYAGRPHWGKSFSLGGAALRALYPGYDAFDRIRRACDPHGVFRNSFVDRVFPTPGSDSTR